MSSPTPDPWDCPAHGDGCDWNQCDYEQPTCPECRCLCFRFAGDEDGKVWPECWPDSHVLKRAAERRALRADRARWRREAELRAAAAREARRAKRGR